MTSQLALVWELARKDLRLFAADRRGAVLCFTVPVVLAAAFGAIFHRPAGAELPRVAVRLACEDDGPLCRHLVTALAGSAQLDVTCCDRATALRGVVDHGGVALVIPAGFGGFAAAGREAPGPVVEVYHAPGSALEARLAEGLFTEAAMREAAGHLLGPLAAAARPFVVRRTAVPDVGPLAAHAYAHSFCGMTLQYLLFWGMDSGLLLLRERRQGIWRRLRAAPVTPAALLAGKALATALVALAQIGCTFAVGRLFFGVTVSGSWLGFAALALAAALLSAATGLAVAALGGTEARARSVAVVAILALSLLGGLWLPSFLLPQWVRRAAAALPTTWAARGFEGVTWQGMGAGPALRCAAAVVGFSALFLVGALWGFRRADRRPAGDGGAA